MRDREREKKTSLFHFLCIHWLLLVCALTRDWTHNPGVLGQCSNQLNYLASVHLRMIWVKLRTSGCHQFWRLDALLAQQNPPSETHQCISGLIHTCLCTSGKPWGSSCQKNVTMSKWRASWEKTDPNGERSFVLFNIVLKVLARAIRQKEKKQEKESKLERKTQNWLLFADDMILYIENLKDATKAPLELRLQDTNSIYKSQLHFYTPTIKYLNNKDKNPIYHRIKKNKTITNKFNQGGKRSVYWKW